MVPPPSYCCMRNVFDSGDHVQAVVSEAAVAGAVDEGQPAERVGAQRGPGRADRPQRIVGRPIGEALAAGRVGGEVSARVIAGRAAADRAQPVEPVSNA